MHSYTDRAHVFADDLAKFVAAQEGITIAEIVGALRIISAMLEARENGGKVAVNIVNVVEEDVETTDPDDWWKN
jgi:hypothetical protein